MPLPFILAAAALAAGAVGTKKGLDAKEMMEEAQAIARRAERRYKDALEKIDEHRENVNKALQDLGTYKQLVFLEHIGHLVKVLQKGRAKIQGFDNKLHIDTDMVKTFERQLNEISLVSGAVSPGIVTAASAISSFGGMMLLGSLFIGPAVMVRGFSLASKAEEALTDAKRYRAKVNQAIEEMDQLHTLLNGIEENIAETRNTIERLAERYQRIKIDPQDLDTLEPEEEGAIQQMTLIGKTLNSILNEPILGEDGTANPRLKTTLKGYLEVLGPMA